jgi:hypothetical protein
MNKPLIALSLLLLSLATGCGQKPAEETASTTTTTAPAPTASAPAEAGVVRTESAKEAPVAPAPAAPALDTQPGPRDTQVALTKALVRGDILTVEVQYRMNPGVDNTPIIYEKIEQVNYIDDATSKKYGVLKDQDGIYMASPLRSDSKELRVATSKNSPAVATFRFAAPPASSQTISLSIPEVGSFNGIALQR